MTPEQLAQFAQLTHERLTVLECAIRALIATHQDPSRLRERFDAIYSQHQVSRAQYSPPDAANIGRRLIGMRFGDKS